MKTLVPAFVFGALTAAPAYCDPIEISSGEHPEFTRLVMAIPETATWEIVSETRNAVLTLTGFDEGFDVSRAFSIIPRTRLRALVASPSKLELQLNCDCAVTSFFEQGRFLVIDISDKTSNPDESSVALNSVLELPTSDFRYGDLLWSRTGNGAQTDTDQLNGSTELATLEPVENTTPPDYAAHMERIRQRVVEAFSDAASKGLIEIDQDTSSVSESVTTEEPEEITNVASIEPVPEDPILERNIRITNSKDLPVGEENVVVSLTGATCPDDGIVDVSSWSINDDFDAQIRRSNALLFDEAGQLDRQEALARAKLYLYFGFGAEAKETLEIIPNLATEHPELFDLAQYFEYGFMKNPRVLHRYSDCASDLALWGVLSAATLPDGAVMTADAALRALEELPAHLKAKVGEDLSGALLQAGDLERASVAMRMVERLPQHDEEKPQLINAIAEEMRQDLDQSNATLNQIISSGSDDSPLALIQLVDRHISDDTPIPADMLQLTEAYVYELRDSELAPDLTRALILASAQSSYFEKAVNDLDEHGPLFDEAITRDIASRVFTKIAQNASDSEFVERYFLDFSNHQNSLAQKTKVDVGERLFALGFWDEVGSMMDSFGESTRAKVLRAKYLASETQYDASLSVLEGLDNSEANEVRGSVLQALGENTAASKYYNDADRPDLASSASWLSEDWMDLVDPADPVFGTFRDVASAERPEIRNDNEMLENLSNAVGESSRARAALETSLQSFVVSD